MRRQPSSGVRSFPTIPAKPPESGPKPFLSVARRLARVAVAMVLCQRSDLRSPAVATAPSNPRASSSL